ncbi:hypothetical protein K469DRAFT_340714 [Zopfia rhizophila CBS 207.26]|uniref:Uncharacterized protein n=1 Tax=Zopfia rhizophila CBS 207.26 TaxID=1314779 RepID=A0A6A6EL59_9PEZI|nr:hypothetical protein K469DRAFT_340714 [Zopfia rhizophila CBS 207.26]
MRPNICHTSASLLGSVSLTNLMIQTASRISPSSIPSKNILDLALRKMNGGNNSRYLSRRFQVHRQVLRPCVLLNLSLHKSPPLTLFLFFRLLLNPTTFLNHVRKPRNSFLSCTRIILLALLIGTLALHVQMSRADYIANFLASSPPVQPN